MKRYAVLLGIILCCISCATFEVNYDFDPEANFAAIKTYDFAPIPEKARGNELTLKHIKYAVIQQLQRKGLSLSAENPDMLIAIHGGKERRVDTQEWGYGYSDYDYYHQRAFPGRFPGARPPATDYYEYRRGMDTYEYEVGTLVLDFVDARKKTLIWRGTASGVIDPDRTREQISEAVTKMLEHFPPETRK